MNKKFWKAALIRAADPHRQQRRGVREQAPDHGLRAYYLIVIKGGA